MEILQQIEKLSGTGIKNLTAKLIKRDKSVCMYLRSDGIYEVFIVKVSEPTEVFGKKYPKREVYPGNENFGKTAWCINSKDRAEKRYTSLLYSVQHKQNN